MPKKHNIAYVKPEEPSFLRKLKEQIGYKEGPTVDTKVGQVRFAFVLFTIFCVVQREDLDLATEDDLRDTEEEQPQVVVLRPGDLTAQEAASEQLRLERGKSSTYTLYKPSRGTFYQSKGLFANNLVNQFDFGH